MDYKNWKKRTKTGGFRRKVQKKYKEMINKSNVLLLPEQDSVEKNISEGSAGSACIQEIDIGRSDLVRDINNFSENESSTEDETDNEKDFVLKNNLQKWALKFNITHAAINGLLFILNKRLDNVLPKDARTLLETNKEIVHISELSSGMYWHSGLIARLNDILGRVPLHSTQDIIHLNINIDGLPVSKSSRQQLWPILCNIFEIPAVPPFVIGIYSGDAKPSNLDAYLGPFVKEMNQLEKGFTITTKTGTEKNVQVRIRAFICDSPARAMIKGVANFNGKHGCLKCTVVGEYSHKSNIVTFPEFNCHKRNNEDFRKKKYGEHHKQDSPLLKLQIDMVEDIPVSDSLHLIDLGVMKRLLIGWRDGNFGLYLTKWRAQDILKVNSFLVNRKMPKEIHRSVRAIDVLAHWKGSEYRSFLYYLSFIILKDVLRPEAYSHFIHFFCAITICSNEEHFHLLRIAEGMLQYFTEHFKAIYGKDYVTSNIHNLSHLVDEVKKFGILQSFNAYPFENKLYCIKSMIRQGNKTLQQVARRLNEKQRCEIIETLLEDETEYPYLKKNQRGESDFTLNFKSFILSSKQQDRWFLSYENHVVELESVNVKNDHGRDIEIHGYRIENTHDAFEEPLKSSYIHIYQCSYTSINKTKNVYTVSDIKCKLVSILHDQTLYFVPLLHTLK